MRKNNQQAGINRLGYLITVILFLAVCQLIMPLITSANAPANYTTVIVEEGDSLWSIAKQYKEKDTDIRTYVNLIQKHNHINSTLIQPGDILTIPIY